MKREGLRSQTKNNMKNNEYKKLGKRDSLNDEYDRVSLKDLNENEPTNKVLTSNDETNLISSSDEDNVDINKDKDEPSVAYKQNLKKDFKNICLLMFLYFLQGIPIGLTGSLPFILSSRKVSYADQGTFSFALWPFSLKLLWAPIVDSVYFKRFGRRKSWLVPVQYLLGLFMIIFSSYTQELLSGKTPHSHDILILTSIFFMLTFLAATQDIVVDGWALTMLSKENVSWGSTCNSVGQTAGWFAGNVIFLTLESADFSNKYVRPYLGLVSQTHGVVTIDKFMYFFGVVYLISTTLVMILKKEHDQIVEPGQVVEHSIEDDLSIKDTYRLMWKIIWLVPIKKLIVVLMTVKIAFASDTMSYLKMIDSGVPKDKLALLAVPLTPLQIVLPLMISRYTNGPQPFNLFIKSIPFRLFMSLFIAGFVFATPYFKDTNNEYPLYYYILCLVVNAIHSIFTYCMFVSQMAFFAKISDKTIGGTYMTFLNTVSNMGGVWPSTLALYVANYLTKKQCEVNISLQTGQNSTLNSTILSMIQINTCKSDVEAKSCVNMGGLCNTKLDAYYIETIACTIFGIIWILYFKNIMYKLQAMPKKAYKIAKLAVN